MRKAASIAMLTIGGLYLASGLFLLIAPLLWNSIDGAEALRDAVRSAIGHGSAIDDDTTIALSLILVFQGIKLLERRSVSPGTLLYALWLLLPSMLAIDAVDSQPGAIPSAISEAIPGSAPAPLIFAIFLTLFFRMLMSMTGSVRRTAREIDGPRAIEEKPGKKALPAPRTKEAERPVIQDIKVADEPAIIPEEPSPAPKAPSKEERRPIKKEEELTENEALVARMLRSSKGEESCQSLLRKRKKLLQIPGDELSDIINGLKGFRVYMDSSGQIGNIEDELSGMILYAFAPFTIIAASKKGSVRKIKCDDMAVPAFSMEQAMEIAEKAVKAYSKGGYAFSALEGELKVSGKDTKIEKDSFIVPWYRKELSYSDPADGDKLFAIDFRLRYSKERQLEPYSPSLIRESQP